MPVKSIEFFNSYKMPVIGLGTWEGKPGETEVAVDAALQVGYRHFDTAYNYGNEVAIGKVLKKWLESEKVIREELFIVTKLPMIAMDKIRVEDFVDRSLKNLQLEYLDLYLIQTPVGFLYREDESLFPMADGEIQLDTTTNHLEIWKSLEEQVDKGKIRSIGLSNFNARQIKRILSRAEIKPACLQVECNANFQQKKLRDFCRQYGIAFCAYAPMGSTGRKSFYEPRKLGKGPSSLPDLLNEPAVEKIAKTHRKTAAQILLRHLVQNEVAVIPKSSNPERIRQNFDILDFELSTEEMQLMDGLDKGNAGRTFIFSNTFQSFDFHPEYPFHEEY